MRPFAFRGYCRAEFQRHHLVPVNLVQLPLFERLFAAVSRVGFDARNFLCNGVLLPATEAMAEKTGLPLHRGPHRRYDDLVAECLGAILHEQTRDSIDDIAAYERVSRLQGLLRRALLQDVTLVLNRNDPRMLCCPLLKLDHDILQLGCANLLA